MENAFLKGMLYLGGNSMHNFKTFHRTSIFYIFKN